MSIHSSNEFAIFLSRNTGLLTMLNLFLASTALLLLCFMLKAATRRWTSQRTQHLLSLQSILALAVLPICFTFLQGVRPESSTTPALISLEVFASKSITAPSSQDWSLWAVSLYLFPLALLIARLVIGLHTLRKIRTEASGKAPASLARQLNLIRKKLSITRKVDLLLLSDLQSPASFGLTKPRIILPAQAASWSNNLLEDVLLHELQHIRRLDWLTMILAYIVVCVYWMNPLSWVLLRQMRNETETACDEAVVRSGRDSGAYASSLINAARFCRDAHHATSTFVQMMLERSTLQSRIVQLLEEDAMKKIRNTGGFRRTAALMSLGTLTLLTGFGSLQMVSAQTSDARAKYDDFRPLVSVEPQYPTQAANEGFEGWVQVSFTVNSVGGVDADSIEIVDSEPADIFNRSARAATAQFKFTPPTIDGRAVSVPGVQYVFRYFMTEEAENKWNEELNQRQQQSQ